MPDDPITPGGETPPEPTTTTTLDPPADPPPGDEHDPVRAKALIDKLRAKEREGDRAARERDALAARLKEREDADLSEQERVAKEREEAIAERDALRATNRENAVKLAVFGQQKEMGIADAELALAALDRTKIEFDETGQPSNVADLLTDLLERKPLLKAQAATPPRIPSTDGGAGGGSPPDLTADELEAARLSGMTPERYAAVKAAMGGKRSASVADLAAALSKKG